MHPPYTALQKNPILTPPISFITHSTHHIHHKCLIRDLILSRTSLHATEQVLRRDLASPVVSPLTNAFSLEQPCDPVRSRPIGLQKKNLSAPPGQIMPFNADFPLFNLFLWAGML